MIFQKNIMRKIAIFFFLFSSFINAQRDSTFVDNKYLEDQLYTNLTYIKLLELPDAISQTGFSYGIGLGFIRDLPLNPRRNIGLGAGLGYALNAYYFNVKEETVLPTETGSTELKSNKVAMHAIEMPFELRFRTSTAQEYRFWRFYPGFRMAYVFATNSSLKQREGFDVEDVIKINKFLYGVTLSTGFNKWNLYVYYGLNDIFTNTSQNAYDIQMQEIRMGLIFYVL